ALPRLFEKTETKKVTPVPHLHLFNALVQERTYYRSWRDYSQGIDIPVARLSFIYESNKVGHLDQTPRLTKMENGKLIYIKRDESFERCTLARLKKSHFVSVQELNSTYNIPQENHGDFTMGDKKGRGEDEDSLFNNWMKFSLDNVSELRKQGWQIEIDQNFPFNLVRPDDEWYSEIDDSSGIDWFEVELGVTLNGNRLNLLPILLSSMRNNPHIFDELEHMPEDGSFLCPMPDGSQLVLPTGRIRTILSFLKDLYNFENLGEDGKLKLSRLDAADLVEFEAAMKAVNLRWFGGERIKKLGQKLKNFSGISSVKPPQNFQAKLRPYQQDGLNWLQFLQEYQLAGILADDMGLGKTVQTLAHVSVEKENDRLDKPVLVISPTSVLPNWRLEAERFTPDLKILTLHGSERKARYDKIKEHDIVLTTYPLLFRDKEELLKETYHTIVLDEAQYIKNPKSKMNQVACQLQADHRLCLTGTPMENHLGELWSLFNFLLPGLLGDEKQFRQFYRKPIEKEQDHDRKMALVRRIKPFIIRRTKDMVAAELPPKTEIIQNSELAKVQRDLYETIRVSMHEKVRQEIANKGLARSHIIVLDALLKLRQVCCDPRLLKLEAAKKVKHSAKLEQLMEMLPEMLEEGRTILLFSQFVSMLTLIEEELRKKRMDYVKLTGNTRDRQTPITQFQNGKVPIFLISLKAGGTGLNLTAADTVIHYDPWWNPAVENQATDRAHRIGQEKPVFVYKLITTGTVEEKILQLQEKKKALAEGVFDPQSKAAKKLTVEDINALFEPIW
ncbi:MAG: DEAD/DEAH box helicase, partial [bacterium]